MLIAARQTSQSCELIALETTSVLIESTRCIVRGETPGTLPPSDRAFVLRNKEGSRAVTDWANGARFIPFLDHRPEMAFYFRAILLFSDLLSYSSVCDLVTIIDYKSLVKTYPFLCTLSSKNLALSILRLYAAQQRNSIYFKWDRFPPRSQHTKYYYKVSK